METAMIAGLWGYLMGKDADPATQAANAEFVNETVIRNRARRPTM